ncbi:hypothetical protein [Goodfellowiella coeruleoviolacea]|uniref:DNA primase/polymerase bifunctional N-terminal domain-containing protein n=1 Tax=Goodfellowiella coeruleoviolacea TaxID=334858 RepID=A0AAE3KJH5_9PSEU|nr:hypothetical protein [Goodfellowiella coeruleoviolacea]MCP2170226.1 hypothetical protein [Goodfellowiella coeruleoviolacea]
MTITSISERDVRPEPGPRRALGEALAGYRVLGWQVSASEQGVFLPLGPATTGLVMPARTGSRVLADLKARMLAGPVIAIPGPREQWIFLAELVALLPAHLRAPAQVQFVRSPQRVVLPPTATRYGPVRWANPPSPSRHWFPPFTAVLALARSAANADQD